MREHEHYRHPERAGSSIQPQEHCIRARGVNASAGRSDVVCSAGWRGTRTARGQYEREGTFPVFSSTHPRKRQAASLFSRAESNICHQNSLALLQQRPRGLSPQEGAASTLPSSKQPTTRTRKKSLRRRFQTGGGGLRSFALRHAAYGLGQRQGCQCD
jgi:hypothetical protein